MRDLMNFKIRVYVEGCGEMNDSHYYEAIYAILSSYREKTIIYKEKQISRRYQLFFHTTSSCDQVIQAVERDFDFSKNASVDQFKTVTN